MGVGAFSPDTEQTKKLESEVKIMTIKLNTNLVPLFSGTYETIWSVEEYADNGDELEVDYNHEDLMKSIAEAYQDHTIYIRSELNCPFIKSIKFTGKFFSPSQYNFSTDELDFDIEVDKKQLAVTLEKLADDKDFEKFLQEHYTSYDGFSSWTPNNYNEIKNSIDTHGDDFEQSIGAVVSFLARENTEIDDACSIEGMVHEDWAGNGYGGLDYKIVN